MFKLLGQVSLMALVACAPAEEFEGDTGSGEKDSAVEELGPCEGQGEPAVVLGSGGRINFEPYSDGDELTLSENSSGARGFYLEAMASGIDMREAVTLVYRVSINGGSTDDYMSRVGLMCDDLEGWNKSFLEFDDAIDTSAVNGASIAVTVVVTNDAGESASGAVTVLGNTTW